MGSSKRTRRRQENTESESDGGFEFDSPPQDHSEDDNIAEGDYESDDIGKGDFESDVEDEDEIQEDMLEEEETDGRRNDEEKDAEMAQLEQEYMELQQVEQNALKNLKRHRDEDLLIGNAVKNQKVLWDKTLQFRFLMQKAYSSSNRLPKEPIRSLFCGASNGVAEAYSDLISSSEKTLDSIYQLQEALLEKNPTIIQASEGNSEKDFKSSGDSNVEADEQWSRISQMHSRMASFRNKSIDKWQRKAQVTTGAASMKGKLHAFNQSISQQVAGYMRDPSKMLKGMMENKSAVAQFGAVLDSSGLNNEEVVNTDGDPELLDDSDFYQQLLKEFFESIDPNSSEVAFYAVKRLQTKKRKTVDRRASKSRKIRYNVHEKIVNFMAPLPTDLPPAAPKLFENLFGLKTKKAAVLTDA